MSLKKILKERYDLISGFLAFISYRYYFNYLLFRGRGVPPEPDDSYFYLSSALNVFSPQNFEQFRLLPFSLWLNFISIFTKNNLETAYQVNFYLGPTLMFLALIYFLKKLEVDRKIRLFLIIILSLYSGSGAYHGFYWVTPSFYQLALFFVILGFLVSKQSENRWLIFTTAFFFIFIHPTSVFVSLIFLAYVLVMMILKKSYTNLFNNFKALIPSLVISYFIYFIVGRLFPSAASPESFQTNVELIKSFLSGNINPISLPVIWQEYFAIFFFNPASIVAYFLMFYFVVREKQLKVLSIFIAALIFVVIGSFIPYGARTLGFLWPLTFIIIGYGLVGLLNFFGKFGNLLKYLTILPVILLIFLATIFNLISIKTLSVSKNYFWDRSCPALIKEGKVFFTSFEAIYAFNLYGLNKENEIFLAEEQLPYFLNEGVYLVNTIDTPRNSSKLSPLEEFLAKEITRSKPKTTVQFAQNAWTKPALTSDLINAELNHRSLTVNKVHDCGKYIIYGVEKI